MRVLHVTPAYYPFLEKRGPAVAVKVRAIAEGLAARGESVTVLTSDLGLDRFPGIKTAMARDRWGWRSEKGEVTTHYLPLRTIYRPFAWNPGLFSFCRDRLATFDAVHIFGIYDLMGRPRRPRRWAQ